MVLRNDSVSSSYIGWWFSDEDALLSSSFLSSSARRHDCIYDVWQVSVVSETNESCLVCCTLGFHQSGRGNVEVL